MSDLVVDASTVLIRLQNEAGSDAVTAAMLAADEVLISAVNLAEVMTRMSEKVHDRNQIRRALSIVGLTVVPFTANDALDAAMLRQRTTHAGLSLGDRACLALALKHNLPVLTADRIWATLDLPLEVILAR